MKLAAGLAALVFALPAAAQTTGTSHPEDLNDNITTIAPAPHYVKPSPAIPMPAEAPALQPRETPAPAMQASAQQPTTIEVRRSETIAPVTDDINSGIVTEVPSAPNELPIGTLLKARLQATLSTKLTRAGTPFTATLSADVERHGKVFLPAGSTITGRITQVHGGHRIGGPAAIRLQPETITLPDGAINRLDADVIDLAHFKDAHVNAEGAIVSNEHPKATLAALGLTTGSAAVAGAMIGGGVGAVVGAGIGAGAGTIWWLKRDRQETLPLDTEVIFSLNNPLQLAPAN